MLYAVELPKVQKKQTTNDDTGSNPTGERVFFIKLSRMRRSMLFKIKKF